MTARYATDSRTGAFSRRVIKGSPIICGLCGLGSDRAEPFPNQSSKAKHLHDSHGAQFTEVVSAAGEPLFVWSRP